MLFNSLPFLVFLPLVFVVYWFVLPRKRQVRNAFFLIASYVFYGWWDYRFLALIAASTLVDFLVGKQLARTNGQVKRKALLWLSLGFNLGLLGFFKYYNFFVESWKEAWSIFGVEFNWTTLSIVLPVGISFYTFQTLSYTIDVYRKKLEPTHDLVEFATYVAFFPQLVAGPIERASHLLPQFQKLLRFNYSFALSGFYLILWGFFKKVVLADNSAYFVDQIFSNPTAYSSGELAVGALLFGLQIYGDFSGYSDIAIGVARLFGVDLMTNFKFPYLSRDIAEFWRRWHISLSTWFRDYLYIPLGGSRGSMLMQIRNVFIVFLVSGLWHGPNWTFIVWGGIHALCFLPLLLLQRNRRHLDHSTMRWQSLPSILGTFLVVTLAWVFFRADTVTIAWAYLSKVVSLESMQLDFFYKSSKNILFILFILISWIVLIVMEVITATRNEKEVRLNPILAIFVVLMITTMGVFKEASDFIYFQF